MLQPLALGSGGTSRDAAKVLIDTCWDRANARGRLQIWDEAFADWNAAYQINQINNWYDADLLARFRAAAEMEMIHKGRIPPADAYAAAKLNARAYAAATATGEPTLQEYHAKRAYDLLTRAKDGGYFRDEKTVVAFASDEDFKALPKERLDAFLTGLAAPPDPKK